MLYSLLYLLKGRLPWQLKRSADFKEYYEHVGKMKRSLTPEELCTGRASFLSNLMTYAYKLKFTDKPNYHMIK